MSHRSHRQCCFLQGWPCLWVNCKCWHSCNPLNFDVRYLQKVWQLVTGNGFNIVRSERKPMHLWLCSAHPTFWLHIKGNTGNHVVQLLGFKCFLHKMYCRYLLSLQHNLWLRTLQHNLQKHITIWESDLNSIGLCLFPNWCAKTNLNSQLVSREKKFGCSIWEPLSSKWQPWYLGCLAPPSTWWTCGLLLQKSFPHHHLSKHETHSTLEPLAPIPHQETPNETDTASWFWTYPKSFN